MIKKLQHKFILISVLTIFAVMTIILCIGNFILYKNINDRQNNLLNILIDNGGYFPKRIDDAKIKNNDEQPPFLEQNKDFEKPRKSYFEISPEAPYENRFFSAVFSDNGNLISINTDFISAISTTQATDMSQSVYKSNKLTGYLGNYKYKKADYSDGTIIVFLDSTRDLDTLKIFLIASVFIITIAMLAVFITVYFFSKIAVKPMEESYKKQKRFITDASHEIKTPLAIIDANTDLIEIEYGESEWTKSNKNQVQRLTKLTNALVSLSRMDEESNNTIMTDFSLSEVIAEESESYAALANTRKKTLDINIEKNISYCDNEQYIRQMIGIFLDNAIKYSNEKGTITLNLKKQGKKKAISIKNTLDYIEVGNHDILFERFYRADNSRNSESGGYGIGLSLAKSIINIHKGTVTTLSRDKNSIEFKIIL
ncbi:MAG: sensor histidine kinase [Peptoanaerobacter stomatis]|uniref:sensor histidine kinase n=1 Tax=Peptoanaerobacter stomatis TaxID=796937 RepID=UPI003F9F7081